MEIGSFNESEKIQKVLFVQCRFISSDSELRIAVFVGTSNKLSEYLLRLVEFAYALRMISRKTAEAENASQITSTTVGA
jgi:hypothetical protein